VLCFWWCVLLVCLRVNWQRVCNWQQSFSPKYIEKLKSCKAVLHYSNWLSTWHIILQDWWRAVAKMRMKFLLVLRNYLFTGDRRLTKRILLTRLPVGHTHEDINGKFETIWQHIVGIAYCWYCSIFETISWYCGRKSIECILRIFGVWHYDIISVYA